MLYLDYAKPLADGKYILSFFADSAADLESISHGQKFVTKNGTDYGVPQAGSTVIVTSPNSGKTTYVMDAEGVWVVTEDISYSAVVANPSDAATAKLEKLKVNDTTYANWTENEIKALAGKGEDGVSVTSFETVSSTVVGDNTNTTVRAHYSNNTADEFVVTAKNGKDGGAKIYLHMITLKGTGRTKNFNFNLFSLRGTAYTISEIIGLLNKATLSETNTICGTYISTSGSQFAALWSATYDASANTSQFKIFTSDGSVDFINASSVDVVTEL